MDAIVAEQGQVTIPKVLRDQLGIRPSCRLSFSVKGDMLIAVKADAPASADRVAEQTIQYMGLREDAPDPVSRVTGCLKTDKTTDELMKDVKELRGAW